VGYSAGIDLGTTFTAAAVSRGSDDRAEIVSLGGRSASIPSVVLLRDDGTMLVGDAAERRAVLEPDRVAREFKRRLGDPTPIVLAGSPHSPEMLQAKLLRSAIDAIAQQEGGPPDGLVVTYPANWGPYKKELLAQVLRMAGLEDATTVTEPEAAAVHYASNERVEPGAIVAVYDLGGGTFDAAVLRKTEDGFEILGAPEGLEHLGGVDIDHAVLSHVNAALGGALERLDMEDASVRSDLAQLNDDCIEAKEALSSDTEVTIPVSIGGSRTDVRLTRSELDEMVRPAIDETVEAMRRAIVSAGVEPGDVARVLLVGGASRMPIVARTVSSELGVPVSLDAHPKHAIALGAALVAKPEDRASAAPVAAAVASLGAVTAATAAVRAAESETAHPQLDQPPPPPTFEKPAKRAVDPTRRAVAVAVIVTLVAAGAGYALFLRPQAQAEEVVYQDPISKGPSPFTEPAVDQPKSGPSTGPQATPHGPFGGTGQLTQCNKKMLARFLSMNAASRRAWLQVLGVQERDFEKYIDSLRPASIAVDTRVTNHGFKNGKAFPLQSILAKGTAVLVDPQGKIVVRCFCGNPLTPPLPMGRSHCRGCPSHYAPPRACAGSACYSMQRVVQGVTQGTSSSSNTSTSQNHAGSSAAASSGSGSGQNAIVVQSTGASGVSQGTSTTSNSSTPEPIAGPTASPTQEPTPPTKKPCYECPG
jgi:actin-like ATPase involved in cell morphogenesis